LERNAIHVALGATRATTSSDPSTEPLSATTMSVTPSANRLARQAGRWLAAL
jgi:hypothetical protein